MDFKGEVLLIIMASLVLQGRLVAVGDIEKILQSEKYVADELHKLREKRRDVLT
ncbi:MAG: hypothetical protein K2G89_04300 [Lachnospiraceae bacterium]|nr:hypothetical protein [Lachnospiraceae bacterium]